MLGCALIFLVEETFTIGGESKMKNVIVVLVALTLFMACEAPMDEQKQDVITYRGQVVQSSPAPFLIPGGLAKDDKGAVVISETSSELTVYGSQAEATVYLADGGEQLAEGTWVGSLADEPIEVSVGANLSIVFETLTEVTLLDADNISYIDETGQTVEISGTAVILTSEIITGTDGSVTLVTSAEFAIGGDGGDPQ